MPIFPTGVFSATDPTPDTSRGSGTTGPAEEVDALNHEVEAIESFLRSGASGGVNVMAYGAYGDGVHDDQPGFTAARAAAGIYGKVIVPSGNYLFLTADSHGNAVSLTSVGAILQGSGKYNTTLKLGCAVTWGVEALATLCEVRDLGVELTGSGSCTYGIGVSTLTSVGSSSYCNFVNLISQTCGSAGQFAVGPDHPGSSSMDIAFTKFRGCSAESAVAAGFLLGNGTGGNTLATHMTHCEAVGCAIGVNPQGTSYTWSQGDMGENGVDFIAGDGAECAIQGVRSENSGQLLTGPSVAFEYLTSVKDVSFSCGGLVSSGKVIDYGCSGTLTLDNLQIWENGSVTPIINVGNGVQALNVVARGLQCATPLWSLFTGDYAITDIVVEAYTQLSPGGVNPILTAGCVPLQVRTAAGWLTPGNPPAEAQPLAGCLASSMSRLVASTGVALGTSGELTAAEVYLYAGQVVGHLAWAADGSAVSPTHQWLCLMDASGNMLAVTADQGTTAIAAGIITPIAITAIASGAWSTFVVPETGVYYVGLCVVAATMPIAWGQSCQSPWLGYGPSYAGPFPAFTTSTTYTGSPGFPVNFAQNLSLAVPWFGVFS